MISFARNETNMSFLNGSSSGISTIRSDTRMEPFVKRSPIGALVAGPCLFAAIWWWHAQNGSSWSYRTEVMKHGDVVAIINASGLLNQRKS